MLRLFPCRQTMPFLALDTSTEYLSLAVTTPDDIVGRCWHIEQKHAEQTLPRLAELLNDCQLTMQDIEGIAFGNGPGSFTGLRIGCGIVQGLAFACDLPVIGISTLEALAQGCGANRVLACLDARMNQVYAAAYERTDAGWHEVIPATVCDPHALPLPPGDDWTGVGSGFAAYGTILAEHLSGKLIATEADRIPQAADMLALALPRFAAGLGRPAQEAELVYLRDKVALKTSERAKP